MPHLCTATKSTSFPRGQDICNQSTSVDLTVDEEDDETVKFITPSKNAWIRQLHKQTLTYNTLVIKYNQATNTQLETADMETQSDLNQIMTFTRVIYTNSLT